MEAGRMDGELFYPDITPAFIKENYLLGLEPAINGEPVNDSFWNHWIRNAIKHVEKQTLVTIVETTFSREPHDYNIGDYQNFIYIQLNNRPISKVISLSAVHQGQKILNFAPEWFRLHMEGGQIQIVPGLGNVNLAALGATTGHNMLPMLAQTNVYIPGFFYVDYTAGFKPTRFPEDVVDAVAKRVAIEVLAQMGDLVYAPGVSSMSTSIDGMSQSMSIVNNGQLGAVFTSRIAQYRKDLYGDPSVGDPGQLKNIKDYYHGITFTSL